MPTDGHDSFNRVIAGVRFVTAAAHQDPRGETIVVFDRSCLNLPPKQVLLSRSSERVLRGLHFHTRQWDVWHLAKGRAQVALIDLRRRSQFPPRMLFEWDATDRKVLVIPPGVAHGYLALSHIEMLYALSEDYDPDDEHSIAWNDPFLDLEWAVKDPLLSERDASAPALQWDWLGAIDLPDLPG